MNKVKASYHCYGTVDNKIIVLLYWWCEGNFQRCYYVSCSQNVDQKVKLLTSALMKTVVGICLAKKTIFVTGKWYCLLASTTQVFILFWNVNVRFLVRKFPSQFKGYWQWLILLVWLSYLRSPFPRPERECWSLPIHKTVPSPNFVAVLRVISGDTFPSQTPYGPLHVTQFALSFSKLNSHSLQHARLIGYVQSYIDGVLPSAFERVLRYKRQWLRVSALEHDWMRLRDQHCHDLASLCPAIHWIFFSTCIDQVVVLDRMIRWHVGYVKFLPQWECVEYSVLTDDQF